MFNVGDIEKQQRSITKEKRRIIFDELPQNWEIRKRVRIASLVVKKSNNVWQSYLSKHKHEDDMTHKTIKIFNEIDRKFSENISELSNLIENSLYLQNKVIESSKKTGINIEQVELAIETIRIAAQYSESATNIPKKESRNTLTERGEHDLTVGRLLIEYGIGIWHAAKILAKIRQKDPFTGAYSQKPKVITDVKKETRAIYDRLQRVFDKGQIS